MARHRETAIRPLGWALHKMASDNARFCPISDYCRRFDVHREDPHMLGWPSDIPPRVCSSAPHRTEIAQPMSY